MRYLNKVTTLLLMSIAMVLTVGGILSAEEMAAAGSISAAELAGIKSALVDQKVVADTLWVMVAGMLVFFMNTGFGMVEAGFTRSKNTVNILSKNFAVFATASLAFWVIGWGLMFGDGNGFMGLKGLFFIGGADNSPATGEAYSGVYSAIEWATVPLLAKFFFQLVFAATAATIVSGAVAERIKYGSFLAFAFILVAFMYPITGHWIWGGGWLANLGMWDFAGSTVVHSVGGWAALAGAIFLGPRFGKFLKGGKINAIPGHSLMAGFLGGFILWLGWFGFNPGSTMAAVPRDIAHIAVTTNTAAIAAVITSMLTSWIFIGKPDLGMTINGALAGLVAITAPCAFVGVGSSFIIGAVAGVIVVFSVLMFDKIKVDDPVGALSVHLVCGIFGTIAVGLFASDAIAPGTTGNGLLFGGGFALLKAQLIGVVAVGAFTFGLSSLALFIIKSTIGLRVSLEEEIQGLDLGEHGQATYPEFVVKKGNHNLMPAFATVKIRKVEPATSVVREGGLI
jgi:Amt family ammonium transporter